MKCIINTRMRKGGEKRFFATLPHPCIIVNANRRTEKRGIGLGMRLRFTGKNGCVQTKELHSGNLHFRLLSMRHLKHSVVLLGNCNCIQMHAVRVLIMILYFATLGKHVPCCATS